MKNKDKEIYEILDNLILRYPQLESCRDDILKVYFMLIDVFENGGKVFIAGNGGSAADSEHIAGELMKRFKIKRQLDENLVNRLKQDFPEYSDDLIENVEAGLPVISLPSMTSVTTAIINDQGGDYLFAQSISSVAKPGDLFWGISTSGNSRNIVNAIVIAKAKSVKTIGLTGLKECKLDGLCDAVIHAPEEETYKIQELHLPIYHALCAMIEYYYWGD